MSWSSSGCIQRFYQLGFAVREARRLEEVKQYSPEADLPRFTHRENIGIKQKFQAKLGQLDPDPTPTAIIHTSTFGRILQSWPVSEEIMACFEASDQNHTTMFTWPRTCTTFARWLTNHLRPHRETLSELGVLAKRHVTPLPFMSETLLPTRNTKDKVWKLHMDLNI